MPLKLLIPPDPQCAHASALHPTICFLWVFISCLAFFSCKAADSAFLWSHGNYAVVSLLQWSISELSEGGWVESGGGCGGGGGGGQLPSPLSSRSCQSQHDWLLRGCFCAPIPYTTCPLTVSCVLSLCYKFKPAELSSAGLSPLNSTSCQITTPLLPHDTPGLRSCAEHMFLEVFRRISKLKYSQLFVLKFKCS